MCDHNYKESKYIWDPEYNKMIRNPKPIPHNYHSDYDIYHKFPGNPSNYIITENIYPHQHLCNKCNVDKNNINEINKMNFDNLSRLSGSRLSGSRLEPFIFNLSSNKSNELYLFNDKLIKLISVMVIILLVILFYY